MTVQERLSHLETLVEKMAVETTAFIRSATEFNANITAAVATIAADVQTQSKTIQRLEAMVSRFDAWLRGQGPTDGHEKRSP